MVLFLKSLPNAAKGGKEYPMMLSLHEVFRTLFGTRKTKAPARPNRTNPLYIEPLEARCMPSLVIMPIGSATSGAGGGKAPPVAAHVSITQ
jgi:hypothetical protein